MNVKRTHIHAVTIEMPQFDASLELRKSVGNEEHVVVLVHRLGLVPQGEAFHQDEFVTPGPSIWAASALGISDAHLRKAMQRAAFVLEVM